METESVAERASQGKVSGVIIPPPDIRAVVDKTAAFVAKHGKSFEEKILHSAEGKTPKFNFMKPQDPYHAYYEFKIREFEEAASVGMVTATTSVASAPENERPTVQRQVGDTAKPAAIVTTTTVGKASLLNPIAKILMSKPVAPPAAFEFSLGHPSGIGALDADVIRLTAQYTAANGRDFLGGLASREQSNPQFDFLRPTHLLFSYFTSLVDAYSKALHPDEALQSRMRILADRSGALEQAVRRWEWSRREDERKKRESVEADEERAAFLAIDWFDFVVVETIIFPVDEVVTAPLGLGSFGPSSSDVRPDSRPFTEIPAVGAGDIGEEADPDIRVVSDYVARVGMRARAPVTLVDPLTGRALADSEVEEHMRVQLMDPRWRIEQQRFLEKQQDTGLAGGADISSSLREFAKRRGDIFGQGGQEAKRSREEQQPSAFEAPTLDLLPTFLPPVLPPMLPPMAPPAIPSFVPPMMPPPFVPQQPPPPLMMGHPTNLPFYPPPGSHFAPMGMPPQAPAPHMPVFAPPVLQRPPPPNKELEALVTEDEFAARFSGAIMVQVSVPNDPSAGPWELNGQTLSLSLSVSASGRELKELLATSLGGLPINKQQVRRRDRPDLGYLKDSQTLASLNVGDGALLEMTLRSRGGKK